MKGVRQDRGGNRRGAAPGFPELMSGRLRHWIFVFLLFVGLWPSLWTSPFGARMLVPAAAGVSVAPAPELPAARLVPVPDTPAPPPAPAPKIDRWLDAAEAAAEAGRMQAAMAAEVSGVTLPGRVVAEDVAARAMAMLGAADRRIEGPQLVVVVDRNPDVERLYLMLASPGGPEAWRALGAARVSTGQAGRKDYYITPLGVFAHSGAILDFRAQGTYNEHHVRGLGLAGMRVWDFGWQWALKGWHTDGEGGDIRLQMHATDPALLERRLGRPASEGCVRVSSTMNRFLDLHGVLDKDYESAAAQDARYRALLAAGRMPTPLAGRLLVVIDSGLPIDAPPTAMSRPANWKAPLTTAQAMTGTLRLNP